MTIDEHIRRQEAGELPEGYPLWVRLTVYGPKTHRYSFGQHRNPCYGCDVMSDEQPAKHLDYEERRAVAQCRRDVDAINAYRRERGEEEL